MVPFGSELVECKRDNQGGAHIVAPLLAVCGCKGMRVYFLVLAVVVAVPRVRHVGFCPNSGVSRVR